MESILMMKNDRISIDFRKDDLDYNLFQSNDVIMMKEDFKLGIEILDNSIRQSFQIKVEPEDDLVKQKLLKIIPTFRDNYSKSLKNHFFEFLDYIAIGLLTNGLFIMERVKISEGNSNYFYLIPVDYDKIVIKSNCIYQCFSKASQEKFNLPDRRKINRDKCYILEFPTSLGGAKYYQKLLNEISLFDRFVNKSLLEMKRMSGQLHFYNFSEHNKISDFFSWKATKRIGWHHRSYNSYEQSGTEHYKFARVLKFKYTSLIIRNYIVENIIHIYEDIAKHLGVQIKVNIDGLTDLSEIESAIDKWYKGELNFEDISKYTII